MPISSKRWVMKLALACFATLMTLLVSEVALRFVLPIPVHGAGEWAGTPRSTLHFVSLPDEFETTHRFNGLGFRGPEIRIQPHTPERILCIGDSWTEGVGADENQTWPAVLGMTLDQTSPQVFEVLNLGDAGSNPDRYLQILHEAGIPLQPTEVIICVIPSDFWGGFKRPEMPKTRTKLRDMFRDRSTIWGSFAANYFSGWTFLYDRLNGRWHHRDGIYWEEFEIPEDWFIGDIAHKRGISREEAKEEFDAHLAQVEPLCLQGMQTRQFNGHRISQELWNRQAAFRCTDQDMGISAEELEASVASWLAEFEQLAENFEFQPTLCFFPESGLVSRRPCGPMIDAYYQDAPDITTDNSLSDLLARVCKASRLVKYIDCTATLRNHSDEQLFLRYDGHPNATAYRLAGEFIAAHVVDPTSTVGAGEPGQYRKSESNWGNQAQHDSKHVTR